MERYTRGMDLDPSNAVLPANRAMALLKLRRYEKGIIKMDWMDGVISGKPWFTYFFVLRPEIHILLFAQHWSSLWNAQASM